MTAEGFGGMMSMDFIMIWLGIGILLIIIMLSKKWLGEEEMAGYPFNWIGSIVGIILYIFIASFIGSARWSLLSGLIGCIAGGFGLGQLWNE